MKKITTIGIILLAMALLCQDAQNQHKSKLLKNGDNTFKQAQGNAHYLAGAITVKLKKGVGVFTKTTGHVALGVPSLDEKLDRFGALELDKRFRYNPAKMKSGMPDLSRIYRVTYAGDVSPAQVAAAFARDPNVEYAEPIPINAPDEVPDDPMYDLCQHLPQIFAPEAWEVHKGEDGTEEIVVAIIDNGVYWRHQDLAENIWQNLGEDADGDGHTMEYNGSIWIIDPDDINNTDDDGNGFTDDVIGWDFGMNNYNPDHNWGENHGTHCSGITAGVTNNGTGLASISWNIKTMPVQVTAETGTFDHAYDGIIYAAENGADAASNSWSSPVPSQANQEAITYAQQLGTVIFASAGNTNSTQLRYPASYTGVISVASVSVDDVKAAYSSYGPAVDISCPGGGTEGGILSTLPFNGYGLMSGTSMACPMTAGSFGLLKSYHPDWTNEELIIQFLGSADDIGALNPDHLNLLGTGRVNAYEFLTAENVTMPQLLKIDLASTGYADANGNQINEPGETVFLNLEFRNFMPCVAVDDVTVTMTTEDPWVTILEGNAITSIPADGYFTVNDQLQFQVNEDASSHYVEFLVTFESETTISWGLEHTVEVLVAPSGTFIFEGVPNGRDHSGSFIKEILDQFEIHNVYANTYPPTLLGFDNVFVSHGNFGETLSDGTMFTQEQALIIQEYLENGGNLFVDMGSMIGIMDYSGYTNTAAIKSLFGIQSTAVNMVSNPLNSLEGVGGSIMEGIHFTGSTQTENWYVDDLTLTTALATFSESDYGIVSCTNDGESTFGHKTFYLCYSLAELIDIDAVNSRNNLLVQVLDFFDMLPEGYILAGFSADKTAGGAPLEVQFTNVSLSEEGYPITSWAWDFNGDGVTDSSEENPIWTFETGGSHSVTLVVTNEATSDTLTKHDCISVNDGYLVYEGKTGGEGYSGTYIRDYMEENGFWSVTYTNECPGDLRGYWAVFFSFGNYDSENTVLEDYMADIIIEYLEDGGYVYLEGGDSFGFDQLDNAVLYDLFGLAGSDDGGYNPIDMLKGLQNALSEDQLFTSTSQQALTYIDLYELAEGAVPAFDETNYGIVAVQNTGEYDQRTFCFSYTLADLDDGEEPNTRAELLNRICGFFDITTGVEDDVQGSRFKVQGFPNPTAGEYSIAITLDQPQRISWQVFDVRGMLVYEIAERVMPAGEHELAWDAGGLGDGIYFCRVKVGDEAVVKKLVKAGGH